MYKVFAFLLLSVMTTLVMAGGSFEEGVQYQALDARQPTNDEHKIEVRELFWYGCPHCYHLEPELRAWLKHKPDDVDFVRMPAVLGKSWELGARAYYTAKLLGVLDKIHTPLFERIHKERKPVRTVAELKAFFEDQGVSAADFDRTFNSFAVITSTNRSRQVRDLYGINGVPTLVVNGKYLTTGRLAGGNEKMLKVVDFLVNKERKAISAAAAR